MKAIPKDHVVVRLDQRVYGDYHILATEIDIIQALGQGGDVRVVSRASLDSAAAASAAAKTARKRFEHELKSAPRVRISIGI